LVVIDADDLVAHLGEARARDQPDVARSDDRQFHGGKLAGARPVVGPFHSHFKRNRSGKQPGYGWAGAGGAVGSRAAAALVAGTFVAASCGWRRSNSSVRWARSRCQADIAVIRVISW